MLNLIHIDRASPVALSTQIETRLRQLVESRTLAGGARLMSIRQLATRLAASTNTVVVAYDRLVAAGIIDSHGTAGFFCLPPQRRRPVLVGHGAGRRGRRLAGARRLPQQDPADARRRLLGQRHAQPAHPLQRRL